MRRLGTLATSLLDLIFPRACAACGRTLSTDEQWCDPCLEALSAAIATPDRYCPRCGRSVGPYLRDLVGCVECKETRFSVDGIARVGPYHGIVGSMVQRYKFGGDQRLDRPLAKLLVSAIGGQPWADQIDALVPVPTTWWNRLRYHFRPSVQLARAVGQRMHLPALPLIRVAGKRHNQVDLPASERPRNVRGVFRLHARARVAGTRLCVVDDVCTSGATLNEIARVLKRAGAVAVYGAVIARTERD